MIYHKIGDKNPVETIMLTDSMGVAINLIGAKVKLYVDNVESPCSIIDAEGGIVSGPPLPDQGEISFFYNIEFSNHYVIGIPNTKPEVLRIVKDILA